MDQLENKLIQKGLIVDADMREFDAELKSIFSKNYKDILYGNESELLFFRMSLARLILLKEKERILDNYKGEECFQKIRKIENKLVQIRTRMSRLLRISVNSSHSNLRSINKSIPRVQTP